MSKRHLHSKAMRRRQHGNILVKIVISIPALLIALAIAWYVFATLRLQYWDNKVREMCEKEGGLQVFEKITLQKKEYALLVNSFGNVAPPSQRSASANVPVVETFSVTHLRKRNPEIRRYEQSLVRVENQTTLAKFVTFSRIGADAGFVDNPSSFSCPSVTENWVSQVINKQGE